MADAVVTVVALDLSIRLELKGREAEALADRLAHAWSRCLTPAGKTPNLTVTLGTPGANDSGEFDTSEMETEQWMESVTQRITVEAITHRAGELLMFHACALAEPSTGRCVLFVGPSGMGKTTIARTLGRSFGYVTDETASLDFAGHLLNYPKPLSIRESGDAKDQLSPDDLGLLRADGDLTVGAVVLLDRRVNAETRIEVLPTVEAVTLLAEHTSYLAELTSPLNRLAALCNSVGGARKVTYDDAAVLVEVARDLLEEDPAGAGR